MRLALIVLYGLLLLVPIVVWSVTNNDRGLAYGTGEAVGYLLIPLAVVTIYFRRRKPPATVGRYLFALFTWMFVGQVIGLGMSSRPEVTEKDVPILMREAAGLSPIREPDNAARKAVRDVYRELIESQRAYEAQVKALQTPVSETLLQGPSFASAEAMRAAMDHLQKMTAVEKQQGDALDGFHQRMLAAIDGLSWSQRKKDDFKAGLRSSFERENPFRQRVLDTELAWFAAMMEVYQFGLENQDKIAVLNVRSPDGKEVPGGQITIADEAVRAEFNQKMDEAEEMRKKFVEANSAFQQNQKANEKKVGVSRDELGLQTPE